MGVPGPSGKKTTSGDFLPNGEVGLLIRIYWQAPFLQPVPCGKTKVVRVRILCPRSYYFDISRQEQRQCFECIWEVIHEKGKQKWAYHGALGNTTAHWNGSREFSTDVYSRESYKKSMLYSTARRHHQDRSTSFSPKEICG